MSELKKAIAYFEDAVRESDEIIAECSPALQAELSEQKEHFVVALDAMRRAQPENEALTLSELRGMGGEPVWIQESAPYTFAGYKILCSPVVDEYEDVCFEGGDCYYSHDYGKTWLAYRHKPERSEG